MTNEEKFQMIISHFRQKLANEQLIVAQQLVTIKELEDRLIELEGRNVPPQEDKL